MMEALAHPLVDLSAFVVPANRKQMSATQNYAVVDDSDRQE